MKALLASLLVASSMTCFAQVPKPPVGVPSDAQFFNGKWYRAYLEKGMAWHRAQERCKQLGGQLVVVPDSATWDFVKGLTKGAQMWLGATDEVTTGVWKWSDGTPMGFTAWSSGQPDNAGGKEHYVTTFKEAWADVPKSGSAGTLFLSQGFICEWKGAAR